MTKLGKQERKIINFKATEFYCDFKMWKQTVDFVDSVNAKEQGQEQELNMIT